MKHCKTLAALFACTLALCLLAACGGGSQATTSFKSKQIEALNVARARAGKNALTESEFLNQIAAKELDAYISFQVKGEISADDCRAKLKAIYKEIESQASGNSCTYCFDINHRVWPADSASWNYSAEDDVMIGKAEYVGNAVKVVDGKIYCSLVIADYTETDVLNLINDNLAAYGIVSIKEDTALTQKAQKITESFSPSNNSYDCLDLTKEIHIYSSEDTLSLKAKELAMQIVNLKNSGIDVTKNGQTIRKNISSINSFGYTTITYNGKEYIIGVVSFTPAD